MKKNILVFPCGSEIGLEVNRALANSIHFELFGANSVNDHGRFVYKNYIEGIPFVDSNEFITEINKIINLYKIDFIVPAHDSVVLKLAEFSHLINAEIVTSPLHTCKVTRSKFKTYNLFSNLISTPKVFDSNDNLIFPLFLKPDVGQGSKGTFKVKSIKEVNFYIEKDPTLLILEYLPGREYTIDCFTNREGKLLFSEGRERVRINNGISVNSKPCNNPEFKGIAEIINNTLPFQGVWFFQLKERDNGELVLMEIAPRIAGTMALFRAKGVNFIQLSLFDKLGFDVDIIMNNTDIEIDRALISRYSIKQRYNTLYIDLDDTIIVDGKVNPLIIRLLYEVKSKNKKIILITKHLFPIKETLSKFAISELLFDEIILLKKEEKKSSYITDLDSIFIDDSFAERKEVYDIHKIPVYSIDAIEALLDWKN